MTILKLIYFEWTTAYACTVQWSHLSVMAFRITGNSITDWTVCLGWQQRKDQGYAWVSLCEGNPSATNGKSNNESVTQKAFPCHRAIMKHDNCGVMNVEKVDTNLSNTEKHHAEWSIIWICTWNEHLTDWDNVTSLCVVNNGIIGLQMACWLFGVKLIFKPIQHVCLWNL